MKKSHEVLKQAIAQCGAKSVATDIGLSQSMIYKWCQPNEGPTASGADNPLDRVIEICKACNDETPIDWLCERTDSFRVKNVTACENADGTVLQNTQSILKEFSDVLEAVTNSYANGQRIDPTEAERIRKEWEDLKCVTEQFVNACEIGQFDQPTQNQGAQHA